MAQFIDKDAVVAEVERKIKNINLNYVSVGSHPSDSDINKKLQDGISKNLQDLLSFLDTLEVKEVDLKDEVDKDAYWKLFKDGTKLNIDSTTEINFDESTKFNLYDYIKMKKEERLTSKHFERMFESIPTVSMKIFSWWKQNKTQK